MHVRRTVLHALASAPTRLGRRSGPVRFKVSCQGTPRKEVTLGSADAPASLRGPGRQCGRPCGVFRPEIAPPHRPGRAPAAPLPPQTHAHEFQHHSVLLHRHAAEQAPQPCLRHRARLVTSGTASGTLRHSCPSSRLCGSAQHEGDQGPHERGPRAPAALARTRRRRRPPPRPRARAPPWQPGARPARPRRARSVERVDTRRPQPAWQTRQAAGRAALHASHCCPRVRAHATWSQLRSVRIRSTLQSGAQGPARKASQRAAARQHMLPKIRQCCKTPRCPVSEPAWHTPQRCRDGVGRCGHAAGGGQGRRGPGSHHKPRELLLVGLGRKLCGVPAVGAKHRRGRLRVERSQECDLPCGCNPTSVPRVQLTAQADPWLHFGTTKTVMWCPFCGDAPSGPVTAGPCRLPRSHASQRQPPPPVRGLKTREHWELVRQGAVIEQA